MTNESNEKLNIIWNRVEATDPSHTKEFNRGGGFKGTSINAQYNIKRATELFGPNGIGWGVNILNEKYVNGKPLDVANNTVLCYEVIHVLQVTVWYMVNDKKYETSPQFGQTTFVGKNKYGIYTDEEAPKKTMTDAMNKCLALLGFGADIFLGMYDDNKYVNDKKAQFTQQKIEEAQKKAANDPDVKWAKELDKQLKTVKSLEELNVIRSDEKDRFKEVSKRNGPLARQLSTTIQSLIKRLQSTANDEIEFEQQIKEKLEEAKAFEGEM